MLAALVTPTQAGLIYAADFTILLLRYVLFAGVAYLIFWRWKKARWQHRRIQPRFPDQKHIHTEIRYSLLTCLIFAAVGLGIFVARQYGYTRIYTSIAEYGWWYLLGSTVVAILAHDTYFYWTHRFMHLPGIYQRVHRVHHLSTNPSPWAAFAFHPVEAVIEAGIFPLLVFMLPLHPIAMVAFLSYMMGMNVLGHLGYELYPARFLRSKLGRLHNTSTHHNMHHQFVKGNYGLYFNWWDQLMGTNHAKYQDRFEKVANNQPASSKVA
ncbi:sterol desaturase family protein [Hymenobacter mucosus]|uniref:Sterol desaturase/sphingolipid hydroxylase, fatty acid hydroxylase superfamily n=1 Tax=Hymenobacter mucosus TaxID=1411120 RepID=A0A238XJ21_9BACT|nr:sterol desaturase family protein [Hymenobacter mucosus]SNR58927.1 Sterol desaturase/sphingolipid hydroxylase, fatty acid hydroxylase superfamily [Hymenobacter mucosus]